MPLKITFELSDRDLRYFKRIMADVRKRSRAVDEATLFEAVAVMIGEIRESGSAEFVLERIDRLELMVKMLEDREWRMEGGDRARVIDALVYFAEREDLIPDRIPVLGYLDDAIMVELVVRELRHELQAYDDFDAFRSRKEKLLGKGDEPASREVWLKARRQELQARMRRRRRRERAQRRASGGSGRSPFALF
jgi:uncharacterized membrane protein YkvA (DUF1232 family)